MDTKTLALFQTLTELPGVPGHEQQVRAFMREQLTPYADEIIGDRLGSIFGVKHGPAGAPKVMVMGHMDEVGFMVTAITAYGMLKFVPLGGFRPQVLLGQRVRVMTSTKQLDGIIMTSPAFLQDNERAVPIDKLFIDIGVSTKQAAVDAGIVPGQQAVFHSPFTPLVDGKHIMAKAWDNRYGVGLAIELIQELHGEQLPNQLYAGASVQEEVGLRGAQTAAQLIQPDIAYIVDASPELSFAGDTEAMGRLGDGTLLRIMDATMITDRRLVEFITDIAQTYHIKYQYYVGKGGTDAGRVHLSGIGVPSTVVGICARYAHSGASIIHTEDYAQAKELLKQLVRHTDATMLKTVTE
ncbi:M42 family metallopeptidase [Paenibacillus yanchengensis]|uniref:M42 family metallopeptidase n=1 Tax=Paenibacillus yanchengensis TaxID=2035833 RepID=A0ABW4YLV9_9BACL